jgi:hypothetical protein
MYIAPKGAERNGLPQFYKYAAPNGARNSILFGSLSSRDSTSHQFSRKEFRE